jgi:hypothetical protein
MKHGPLTSYEPWIQPDEPGDSVSIPKATWTPLLIALIVLGITLVALAAASVRLNRGQFVYTLDDPYIHMAIAKNLATQGVWGVTPHEFSPAGSSALWPVLLAGIYTLSSSYEVGPFLLNVAAAVLSLSVAHVIMRRFGPASATLQTLGLLAVLFVMPLPAMVFAGMEHTAHAAATLALLLLGATEVGKRSPQSMRGIVALAAAGMATVGLRYEGLFAVAVIGILLVLRRRPLSALAFVIVSAIPVLVLGAFSVHQGNSWLPNPLLLKAARPSIAMFESSWSKFAEASLTTLRDRPPVFSLFVLATVLLVWQAHRTRQVWHPLVVMPAMFVMITALHMQFIAHTWFFRYEAYLVASGIIVVLAACQGLGGLVSFCLVPPRLPKLVGAAVLCLLLCLPLVARAYRAASETTTATRNIYEQQYQMGLFLRDHYPGVRIAANDIGAIAFLADIKLLDLVGLASREVMLAQQNRTFGQAWIDDLGQRKHTQLAIIYDTWFKGQVPTRWTKVGEWEISNNVVCGDTTVSFYAVDPSEREHLVSSLTSFASRLPNSVVTRLDPGTWVSLDPLRRGTPRKW